MAQSTAACRTTGKSYRVTNWKQYNESLVRRGEVTLWLEDDVILGWEHENADPKVGRPFTYSDAAVRCLLSLREVFGLTYRQTEGFGRSLVKLMDSDVAIPDYTSLQKRASKMEITLNARPKRGPIDIVVDSTGLKVYGEGEWKTRRHGASKRRTWRKVHIGIDPETGEIVAEESTGNDGHDARSGRSIAGPSRGRGRHVLRRRGLRPVEGVRDARREREIVPIIPPRKNAKIRQHGNSQEEPLERDEAIRGIRAVGRAAWKSKIGYHRRSLVETTMYRFKTIFGDRHRARKPPSQRAESRLRCSILNRFTQLGRPQFVWS